VSGHVVDSSDRGGDSPDLAALDAAMAATDGMPEWQLFRRREAQAKILETALAAAAPAIRKAERLRIREMAARAQASVYDRATDEWHPLADLIPEELS
jgi:hypothetical protein